MPNRPRSRPEAVSYQAIRQRAHRRLAKEYPNRFAVLLAEEQAKEGVKHIARAGQAQHGTRSRYVGGGCRCASCRAAAATYAREYKARRAG